MWVHTAYGLIWLDLAICTTHWLLMALNKYYGIRCVKPQLQWYTRILRFMWMKFRHTADIYTYRYHECTRKTLWPLTNAQWTVLIIESYIWKNCLYKNFFTFRHICFNLCLLLLSFFFFGLSVFIYVHFDEMIIIRNAV